MRPPQRLRSLISWQAGRVHTIGGRLTAARMPLNARSDFALLAALDEYGPVSQADLGRRLGLDRNAVNLVVTRLEGQGAITRTPDPDDRRRNTVALTTSGARQLAALQVASDAVQAELTAALTPSEREDLQRLLAKVLEAHPALPS